MLKKITLSSLLVSSLLQASFVQKAGILVIDKTLSAASLVLIPTAVFYGLNKFGYLSWNKVFQKFSEQINGNIREIRETTENLQTQIIVSSDFSQRLQQRLNTIQKIHIQHKKNVLERLASLDKRLATVEGVVQDHSTAIANLTVEINDLKKIMFTSNTSLSLLGHSSTFNQHASAVDALNSLKKPFQIPHNFIIKNPTGLGLLLK